METPDTSKLISLPGTPNTESQTPRGEDLDSLISRLLPSEKPLRDVLEGTSNLRFGPDRQENPFQSTSQVPILPTFPTWESTDNLYYYNILNRRELAKRKVTFGQTITTLPSNLLSGKQPRYQIRYQTRSNNSPEESPDDDDNNNDDDDANNPSNYQPN